MSLILGEQTLSTDSMQNTTLAFLHRKHAWVSLFLLIFMQCRGIRVKNLQRRLWEQVLAVVLLCWVSYWYSCCTVWGKKFKKLQWRSRLCPTALTTNRNSLTKKATETIPFIFYSTLNQFRQLSRPSGHSVKTPLFSTWTSWFVLQHKLLSRCVFNHQSCCPVFNYSWCVCSTSCSTPKTPSM